MSARWRRRAGLTAIATGLGLALAGCGPSEPLRIGSDTVPLPVVYGTATPAPPASSGSAPTHDTSTPPTTSEASADPTETVTKETP